MQTSGKANVMRSCSMCSMWRQVHNLLRHSFLEPKSENNAFLSHFSKGFKCSAQTLPELSRYFKLPSKVLNRSFTPTSFESWATFRLTATCDEVVADWCKTVASFCILNVCLFIIIAQGFQFVGLTSVSSLSATVRPPRLP